MAQPRFRLMYRFWLDINNADQRGIAERIEEWKASRTFAKAVRDGLTLIAELQQGRVDALWRLFPGVVNQMVLDRQNAEIQNLKAELARVQAQLEMKNTAPPASNTVGQGGLGNEIQTNATGPAVDLSGMDDWFEESASSGPDLEGGRQAVKNFQASLKALKDL